MGFSFFAYDSPAGDIRGKQISERIGGRLNPNEGYENDICIYVKHVPEPPSAKMSYVDILDTPYLIPLIQKYDSIGIISFTQPLQKYLSDRLHRNVKYIQQHHCNFEREKRVSGQVRTVGYIGGRGGFHPSIHKTTELFRRVGLEFICFFDPKKREDVVSFYKKIDIQVSFRYPDSEKPIIFKDSLKVINAGSFGIPTVSLPEPDIVFRYSNCFIPVRTVEEMLEQCMKLKEDKGYYDKISNNIFNKSEERHIENIVETYRGL